MVRRTYHRSRKINIRRRSYRKRRSNRRRSTRKRRSTRRRSTRRRSTRRRSTRRRRSRNKMKGGSKYVAAGTVIGGVAGGVASLKAGGNLGRDVTIGAAVGAAVGAKAASNRIAKQERLLIATKVYIRTCKKNVGPPTSIQRDYLGPLDALKLDALFFPNGEQVKCPYDRTKVVKLMDKLMKAVGGNQGLTGIFPVSEEDLKLQLSYKLWNGIEINTEGRNLMGVITGDFDENDSLWKTHHDLLMLKVLKGQRVRLIHFDQSRNMWLAENVENVPTAPVKIRLKVDNLIGYIPANFVVSTTPPQAKVDSHESVSSEVSSKKSPIKNVSHKHYMKKNLEESLWREYTENGIDNFALPYVTHIFILNTGGVESQELLPISRLVYSNWNAGEYFVEFIPSFYLNYMKDDLHRFNNQPELDLWEISRDGIDIFVSST